MLPGAPYSNGRYCNGPVWLQQARQLLGITVRSYAISGSTTGLGLSYVPIAQMLPKFFKEQLSEVSEILSFRCSWRWLLRSGSIINLWDRLCPNYNFDETLVEAQQHLLLGLVFATMCLAPKHCENWVHAYPWLPWWRNLNSGVHWSSSFSITTHYWKPSNFRRTLFLPL